VRHALSFVDRVPALRLAPVARLRSRVIFHWLARGTVDFSCVTAEFGAKAEFDVATTCCPSVNAPAERCRRRMDVPVLHVNADHPEVPPRVCYECDRLRVPLWIPVHRSSTRCRPVLCTSMECYPVLPGAIQCHTLLPRLHAEPGSVTQCIQCHAVPPIASQWRAIDN